MTSMPDPSQSTLDAPASPMVTSTWRNTEGWGQRVSGRCPACGGSLFVASGGHITCSYIPCPNPTAVCDFLLGETRLLVRGPLLDAVTDALLSQRERGGHLS